MDRYVVVDPDSKTIVGGPYLWDGKAKWEAPETGDLVLESDASKRGYRWPEADSADGS